MTEEMKFFLFLIKQAGVEDGHRSRGVDRHELAVTGMLNVWIFRLKQFSVL